jgi:hypothetical protein
MYFLRPGVRREIWDDFDPSMMDRYRGDQDWIGDRLPDEQTIPRSWIMGVEKCKSFRPKTPPVRVILCNKIKNKTAARRFPWVREIWN